jgi:hypothetical protein
MFMDFSAFNWKSHHKKHFIIVLNKILVATTNSLGQVGHYPNQPFPESRTYGGEDAHVMLLDDNFSKVKKNRIEYDTFPTKCF